jgi:hypothetical protein
MKTSMKFAVALALATILLASPLVCVALPCDLAKAPHDCCPKSSGVTACPYDVLESAKASRPPVKWAVDAIVDSAPEPGCVLPGFAPQSIARIATDQRDLHTRIRVLLI